MKKKWSLRLDKDPLFGLLLVVPLLLWVLSTRLYPTFEAIRLSLYDVGFVGMKGQFIRLENYLYFLKDPEFLHSLLLTLWWTILNTVGIIFISFVVALVLNQDFKGKMFVRNWIILPWVFPSIVLATMGKWFLDPTLGLLNYLLIRLGLLEKGISFLGQTSYALYANTILNVWRWFPFFAVIFLASLQTIPVGCHESAQIDGANRLQRLWYIDIKLMSPVIKISVLLSSLYAANLFDIIWMLTRGGPNGASTTLPILIYQKAFLEFRISQSSTIAVIMFIILLIYGLIYFNKFLDIELEG